MTSNNFQKNKFVQYLVKFIYFAKIILKDIYGVFISDKDKIKLNHLDIEPTNICNANCVFCAYQYQEGERYKTIDFNFVEKLLNSFCSAGGGNIGLTPIVGDPLVSQDLEKLIAMCKSRKEIKCIGLTTNGILLTGKRFIAIKDLGITDIVISMSYPEEAEYEKIYRSKKFNTLMSNLNDLLILDKGLVNITLAIRTPRLSWNTHPLFKRAKASGWNVCRNFFFDDWSSSVTDALKEHGLLLRPLRGKHLPCTMLQSGPHALSSGKITACGCRDLEGKSELADEKLFSPFYESGDLKKVYYGTMDSLRQRFLQGNPPSICASCRHYTPEYRFATLGDKIVQILLDVRAALGFILCMKT